MEYRAICNAGLALVLGAGLGFGFLATSPVLADEGLDEAETVATSSKDTAGSAEERTVREVEVAEGLSDEDAAAVEKGMTVKVIGQYYSNLREAIEVANQNGGGTVTLLADTVATDDSEQPATIGFRTSIMIKSESDEPLSIYRAEGQTGAMLVCTDGTIRLKNVVFDGSGEKATAPVITVSDQAQLTLKEGASVTGNKTDGSDPGSLPASAISVSGSDAVLTLEEGCGVGGNEGAGDVEAAIYNSGATVKNEGAVFEDNTAEYGENPNYAGDGKLSGEDIEA